MKRKTLIEAYPSWNDTQGLLFGGIFADFARISGREIPWGDDFGLAHLLDMQYYGNRSGDKFIAPLLNKLIVDDELTNRSGIAETILTLYETSWSKEFATISAEYNPIENYSMLEQMTNDITSIDYGRTDTRTDNLKRTEQGSTYGFNSSTPVDADKTVTDDTGTQGNVASGRDTHTRNYKLTRSGNVGVTTSQQMLESERKLWLWSFFENVVFPDIDRVLTLQIY